MVWTKWYWTKWHGQNGTDKMVGIKRTDKIINQSINPARVRVKCEMRNAENQQRIKCEKNWFGVRYILRSCR